MLSLPHTSKSSQFYLECDPRPSFCCAPPLGMASSADKPIGRQLMSNAMPASAAAVPRRDKSLSALSHELIARYGQDGTVIDLDEVQVIEFLCHILHQRTASFPN